MNGPHHATTGTCAILDVLAFRLRDQKLCVRTTTIREIRGWGPATPIPHAPANVVGGMNLRGSVIPIIDLDNTLGTRSTEPNKPNTIVVAKRRNQLVCNGTGQLSTLLSQFRVGEVRGETPSSIDARRYCAVPNTFQRQGHLVTRHGGNAALTKEKRNDC